MMIKAMHKLDRDEAELCSSMESEILQEKVEAKLSELMMCNFDSK